jgi:hypothetical protein
VLGGSPALSPTGRRKQQQADHYRLGRESTPLKRPRPALDEVPSTLSSRPIREGRS